MNHYPNCGTLSGTPDHGMPKPTIEIDKNNGKVLWIARIGNESESSDQGPRDAEIKLLERLRSENTLSR